MSEPDFIADLALFKLKNEYWKRLEEQINTFCKGKDGSQIFFAITGEQKDDKITADSLIILPIKSLCIECGEFVDPFKQNELLTFLSRIKRLIAFGYVRREDGIEPKEADYEISGKIDRRFGRPIYYIIMNSNFEFMPYRTPPDVLPRMLQPVDEDENV